MLKSIAKIVVVLLLIAVIVTVSFFDFTLLGYKNYGALTADKDHGVRKGLDLTGGSVIVYEAQPEKGQDVTAEDMSTVITVMRKRLDSLGYTEALVSKQGDNRIRVEIPNISSPEEAAKTLGKTAQLKFIDAEGKEVMNGADIKSAKKQYGQTTEMGGSENYIELKMTAEGTQKFSAATKKAAEPESKTAGKNFIAIALDGDIVSQPMVDEAITTDTAIITGDFTAQQAEETAQLIASGQLPFSLNEVELRSVGPTLGEKALETSLAAAGIGIAIILLFMIIWYRVPGLAAAIALCAYVGIFALIMGLFRINLTLPGFAGIILSVGMAVDANVIIFERIKEELNTGKTVRASVGAGFKRAFAAIIDSNVTTLIAAVVLYIFGTGTIRGFAITLGLGIVISMITAIFVTKFILNALVGILGTNHKKLYGAK